MNIQKSKWLSHPAIPIVLWVAIPLALGILLSLAVPRPIIGVIDFRDAIYSSSSSDLITQLTYAREHAEVRAVVIILDSPGGTVADTESSYAELERFRQVKPVVTVVEDMAASGAYYLAAGSDYIFAQPSSLVGNVGVRTVLPSNPAVYEDDVSTGPYKFTGDSRDSMLRMLDPIKLSFYQAVVLGRGSALKATADEILSGKIYLGMQAVQLGLVDAIGTQSQAIDYAAQLSHVWNFESKDLRELSGLPPVYSYSFFQAAKDGSLTPYPRDPGVYFLYIPPSEGSQP
jgi:protease-4